MSFKWAKKN